MGYNFDPMTGQPLRPSISSGYSFLSQSPEMLLSTSLGPSLADLPGLLDIDDEEPLPLVVEPPACSSCIVMGWGGTHYNHLLLCGGDNSVSLTQVEVPRVSTSSTSTVGRDVWRVIQKHPPTSGKKVLVQAGVGQGSVIARKLVQS